MATTALSNFSDANVKALIQVDLRRGTPGLRRRAAEFGFRFSTPTQTSKGRGVLRPGQFLIFINKRRTQIVALDYAGTMVRSVDKGRTVTLADVQTFASSLGITLNTSTKKSRVVQTAAPVTRAAAAPAAAVTVMAAEASSTVKALAKSAVKERAGKTSRRAIKRAVKKTVGAAASA